jgi:predicted P-loop ATPase
MSNAPIYLAPQHEAKLRSSCVHPSVAAERGYYSITDVNALRMLGFSKFTVPPAIAIPMYDYAGIQMTIVRPDAPRIKDGKPVKYDRPGGQKNIIDIHPRVRPVLQDPKIPLCITEAPLKADALISQGQYAIGGVGCWFFRTKSLSGGKVILPDFQHIAWNGRVIRIVFDSDVSMNANVALAERRLALYLVGQGAHVWCARLPTYPDGSKMGVDDYFASGKTVADLMQLMVPFADRASRDWTSEEAISALSQLGYSFQMNTTTDAVEVNSKPITDAVRARMLSQMRDLGFKSADAIENAYTSEASDFSYHPVRDWLESLTWDGKDRLLDLGAYFRDTHDMVTDRDGKKRTVFDLYLRRFIVGAVAKVMKGEQNMMLVLDGPQRLGKSYFSSWLCSPLPDYFIEAPIRPDDKDYRIRLVEKFIWEVAELDATTRRQDVSALKSFITERTVTVRRPYGHHDVTKPAMASLIGTINNNGGFLADPTGSSRFLVVTLEKISFKYAQEVNVTQLWAQAAAMYRAGEPWALSADERKQQDEINEAYQTDDPLEGALAAHFLLDVNEWLPTNTIVEVLAEKGHRVTPHALGVAAKKLGLKRERRTVGGHDIRGLYGIQAK